VPCKKELPAFAAVHQELGDRVRFVGLNLQDTPERAQRFARDAGVGYEILLDTDQQIALDLDLANFPSTLFVDASGHIVDLHQGALTADELRALITNKLGV
jgi:thiol-disulfide isomerase/thioredoxin